MATAAEMARYIGRRGLADVGGMRVEVEVTDARERFGQVDLEIIPTAGDQKRAVWITELKVDFNEEET